MTIIDPDQLRYAEQKFPQFTFTPVPHEDLGDCQECDDYYTAQDAEVKVRYRHGRWDITVEKCGACLTTEIGFLLASPYVTDVRVEAPLREEGKAA